MMKTVGEVLADSTAFMQKKGLGHARRAAEDLLQEVLGATRLSLYTTECERPLTDEELEQCRAGLRRRSSGEPLAYIAGEVEFYGCTLEVNSAVLIPRQETELLVNKIAKSLESADLASAVLWDLCCGSGCIGIALKKRFPELTVVLSDCSTEALAVAERNAARNEVKVELVLGDFLEGLGLRQVDYLVCNPPYVAEAEYAELESSVREWEPKLALVGGPTGLEFYQKLAIGLPLLLKSGGRAWFEMGQGQGAQVEEMFKSPVWQERRVEQDWAGHDRFFFLAKE